MAESDLEAALFPPNPPSKSDLRDGAGQPVPKLKWPAIMPIAVPVLGSNMLEKMKPSARTAEQSGFRQVMVLAASKGCVNLGPGMCAMESHPMVREAALKAIASGNSSYAEPDGAPELKTAVANRYAVYNQMKITPANVLVTCGATGAFECVCKCFLEPGDEVLMFDPYYQYHARQVVERGGVVRCVGLRPPAWNFSAEELENAITEKTKLLVMANPNNPTGKVFSREELTTIGSICRKHGVIVVCDEVYEYLVSKHRPHLSMAGLPDMFEHTLTLSSAGKTFLVTGWRVGWVIGPSSVIPSLTVKSDETFLCAPAPLQHAVAECLTFGADYFEEVESQFERKRARIFAALQAARFTPHRADGAFYVLAGYERLGYSNDFEAVKGLIEDFGVIALPGSVFSPTGKSTGMLRFCFAVEDHQLDCACDRLANPAVKASRQNCRASHWSPSGACNVSPSGKEVKQ
jgi:aminotransferase